MDREALEVRLNELEPKPAETGEAVKPAEGAETAPKPEGTEAPKPAQEAVPNEATVIKERIAKIDKMQENEFNTLISQSELKSPKGVGKLFGKKSEYAKIEARIKSEVKKPEIQAKLLKKLEAKKQLLEDIGNLKKHPKFEEYKELVKRADDEVSLQLLEDRIAKDNGFFTSRTRKAERSQLYREIFKNTEASKIYYEDEIAKSEAELAALKEKLGNERKSIGTLLKQKKKLEGRRAKTERAIDKKQAKLEELKEKRASNEEIKALEDELADLRANHERYQSEYETLKTELESKQAELTKAKEKLAKKQEKLKAVHKAGGAFFGGVAGAQAIQNGGEAANSMAALLAALAMDESEEVTDEESEEEVIEDAATEEESIEEESVEDEVTEDAGKAEDDSSSDESSDSSDDSSSDNDDPSGKKSSPSENNNSPTATDPAGGNNGGNTTVNGNSSDPNVTRRQPVGPPPPQPINEQPDPEEDDDDTITPDGLELTIDNYINGRDENGNRTEITPAQRMILTKQIEDAQTLDDTALIYSEMRSFKVFNGRKNLRKALKQKRKLIEAKIAKNESKIEKREEKFEKRMDKVENNNTKHGATPDMDLSGVTQLSTADIINQEVQKPNLFQKFVLGRQNEIDLTPQTDLSESAVTAEFAGEPVSTDGQIQTTNLSTGDSPILAQTDAPPTETVDITPGEESAQNISQVSETETPVETPEQPYVAMVDTDTEDENKHKLDLSDDMFGMA